MLLYKTDLTVNNIQTALSSTLRRLSLDIVYPTVTVFCLRMHHTCRHGQIQHERIVRITFLIKTYLDSLCFGTLSPYNSTSVNNWVERDPVTGTRYCRTPLCTIRSGLPPSLRP